uniref:Uncharacterized protein n=1 Tax=Arundo donax TaxID=35708 RepID=A0A0A9D234_ARUDO
MHHKLVLVAEEDVLKAIWPCSSYFSEDYMEIKEHEGFNEDGSFGSRCPQSIACGVP